MSTFKIKHDKTKHTVHINTLDETHKKIMISFQNRKTLLPKKKKRIQTLKSQLQALENIDASKYTTDDIKKRSYLKTEIKTLENEIYDIENNLSELDYYCKTEDIIMDYYQLTDIDDHILYEDNPELSNEKNNGDANNNTENKNLDALDMLNIINKNRRKPKKVTKRRKKRVVQTQQSSILDFLSGNVTSTTQTTVTETEEDEVTETETEFETESSASIIQPQIVEKVKNKAELLDQYMMLIDSDYVCDKKKMFHPIRKCDKCNIEQTLINSEGIFVCQQCGEFEIIIIDSEKPNYKEAVTDAKPGYPYKRINHLNISIFVYFFF
ncbi:VLTF3 late transcription factor [Fadolivirus algeromassiliense]|jgi:predicted RNA-binding Zn-ribbon protein involved in translation (DUF1610 family)|uniref:VLTF3 late transcription factor n=1 Tax=Fadolivirus FV1/VV64 TaxID=3070911 RepID=A0A7D3QU77_9VIRU|nr:VLTF3 late transcription factor [Fadolivirus algeromassiliense]QKF93903.1 VLTF3 late transcription factor [Fadolivirus FV1/VV64]